MTVKFKSSAAVAWEKKCRTNNFPLDAGWSEEGKGTRSVKMKLDEIYH